MLAAKQLIKLKAVPADPTNSAKVTKCLKKAFKWSSKLPYVNISKKIKKDDKALEYYGTYGFTKVRAVPKLSSPKIFTKVRIFFE